MFSYDDRLLVILRARPQSIGGVLEFLEAIEATCVDQDGLKWFNWLYLRVTRAVAEVADEWLAELDVRFASLYFGALQSWLQQGSAVPECWRVLFDTRLQTQVARIQFALAGINAHINHDLCGAIVATCEATGTRPEHGGIHYAHYTALNGTLDAQVDEAKRVLMVRLLGDDLPPVSHLEATLAAWSVTAAREKAWLNAELMWRSRDLRGPLVQTLDGLAAVVGKTLLVPVP